MKGIALRSKLIDLLVSNTFKCTWWNFSHWIKLEEESLQPVGEKGFKSSNLQYKFFHLVQLTIRNICDIFSMNLPFQWMSSLHLLEWQVWSILLSEDKVSSTFYMFLSFRFTSQKYFWMKSVSHLLYGWMGSQFPLCGCSINHHYSF